MWTYWKNLDKLQIWIYSIFFLRQPRILTLFHTGWEIFYFVAVTKTKQSTCSTESKQDKWKEEIFMLIMVKALQFSEIIFTYRMLLFFRLNTNGHITWPFTQQESLKWRISHRGQLQKKYFYVASLKAAWKLRYISNWLETVSQYTKPAKFTEHVWLSVAFWIAMFFPPLVSSLKLMNKKAEMEWGCRQSNRFVF